MSYVLVSLVDESDMATVDSDLLARRLRETIGPAAFHSHVFPDHGKIKADADAAGGVGVLLGHNGAGTLRAVQSTKVPWADGPKLAEMFRDGRIFVFACNTLGNEVVNPLGQLAVEAGVGVFVGHASPISPPDSSGLTDKPEFGAIQDCFLAMIRAFLDGEDEEGMLQTAGWDSYNVLQDGIGFSEDSPGIDFWPFAVTVQRLITSLKVRKRI